MAPVVLAIDRMWARRTDPSRHRADGQADERCNCLWLGAGGSGKTWAYMKVIRPLLQRFFRREGYVVGAPTHAAVRLLGREARTLHKLANVSPSSGLDRKSLRVHKGKIDLLEKQIVEARAAVLDELSMTPPDVYHAAGYRFSLQRAQPLSLDLSRYLDE